DGNSKSPRGCASTVTLPWLKPRMMTVRPYGRPLSNTSRIANCRLHGSSTVLDARNECVLSVGKRPYALSNWLGSAPNVPGPVCGVVTAAVLYPSDTSH